MGAYATTRPAAKEARQKKVVIAGTALLVPLLAVQVPRTMDMLDRGGETPAPATATPAAPATAAGASGRPQSPAGPATDAPARSLGQLTHSEPSPAPAPGQLRSFERFPLKDPFVARVAAPVHISETAVARPDALAAGEKPSAAPAASVAWTVVLASVPVGSGEAVAKRAAARFSTAGLTKVGVLNSSEYRSLRPGYYVVFSNKYPSKAAAYKALAKARAASPTAYPRLLEP